MGESAEPVRFYLELMFCCNFNFSFSFFFFFGFHWKEKDAHFKCNVYKLLCYNKINVYTKDLMLFCQNRCSQTFQVWLHNNITSNFCLPNFVFFDTHFAGWPQGCADWERDLNHVLTSPYWVWAQLAAVDLYPWFLSQFGIFFLKWAFSYPDLTAAPTCSLCHWPVALCHLWGTASHWSVLIGSVNCRGQQWGGW